MNRVLSAAGAAGAAYNSRPVITDGTTYESSSLSSPSARSRSDTRNPGSGSNKNNESSDDENENPRGRLDPSPTGYRDYTPPAELLRNTQSEYHHHHQGTSDPGSLGAGARVGRVNDDNAPIIGSACSSSTFTDRRKNDEAFTHKTILLGDSGVGKTSLLVQFDTGEFQTGNFAATVGIGFTGNMSAAEEKEEPTSGGGSGSGADGGCADYEEPRSPIPGIGGNDWSFGGSVAAAVTARLRGPRARSFKTSTKRRVAELLASHQRHSFHETPNSSHQRKQPTGVTEPCEHSFKVMLLGDSGVGKTCLLTRFRDGRFLCGNFITTVGIDFRNKIVTVDNTRVKLQIWDTAGQERFRSITHAYYRDAHALLLLYDVTNKTSYDNIRAWLTEIREYAHDDVVIMLLGNKCDCGNERTVRKTDGERLAREHNVPFMETSAKTGLNVELAFFAVARQLKARKSEDPDKTKFNVQDYVRQQSQASNCFTTNCSTT